MKLKYPSLSPHRYVKRALAFGCVASLACTAFLAQATDHVDFIKDDNGKIADPVSDITDLFAFRSPNDSDNLVLIMNTNNSASSLSRFSDAINYTFRLRPVEIEENVLKVSEDEFVISCYNEFITGDYSNEITAPATAPHGNMNCYSWKDQESKPELIAVTRTNVIDGDSLSDKSGKSSYSSVRLFAGERHDAFFIDVPGIGATLRQGEDRDALRTKLGITDLESGIVIPRQGASNSLAPFNTMSIVLEFNPNLIFETSAKKFAVVAETSKRTSSTSSESPSS